MDIDRRSPVKTIAKDISVNVNRLDKVSFISTTSAEMRTYVSPTGLAVIQFVTDRFLSVAITLDEEATAALAFALQRQPLPEEVPA